MTHVRPPRKRLIELYITQELTTTQIAALLKVSSNTATRWLKNAHIPRRKKGRRPGRTYPGSAKPLPPGGPLEFWPPTREALHELYSVKGWNCREIAHATGKGASTVHEQLVRLDIPRRPRGGH